MCGHVLAQDNISNQSSEHYNDTTTTAQSDISWNAVFNKIGTTGYTALRSAGSGLYTAGQYAGQYGYTATTNYIWPGTKVLAEYGLNGMRTAFSAGKEVWDETPWIVRCIAIGGVVYSVYQAKSKSDILKTLDEHTQKLDEIESNQGTMLNAIAGTHCIAQDNGEKIDNIQQGLSSAREKLDLFKHRQEEFNTWLKQTVEETQKTVNENNKTIQHNNNMLQELTNSSNNSSNGKKKVQNKQLK